jgi:hypothetical protein
VRPKREAWFEGQLDLDPDKLVFIDETGATTKMARRIASSQNVPEPRLLASSQMLPC